MTIAECRKRKREYKSIFDNIESLKLALIRSIAIEDMNIADLKKQENEQKEETNEPLVQVAVWQVYTKEHTATGQIYTTEEDAKKCAEAIDGYVVEARLIEK